jgi:nitrate/TMAO reductase-like tetraheme cytochrome c subunit
VSIPEKFQQSWLRTILYLGRNHLSLLGGAIATASSITLLGYWAIELIGRGALNPYLGLLFIFLLPVVFILGLLLIPIGILIEHRRQKKAGLLPDVYPRIEINDPLFRRALDFVLLMTIVNVIIVATASYRGIAYMDTPGFCGQTCHVMKPEFTAYKVSPHSHVECATCHIGSGVQSFFLAKVNGTKQMIEVAFNTFPRPVPSPVHTLRPARDICESCHMPAKFIGDKLLVKTSYADDEANTRTKTIVLLHLGGLDSVSHRIGIHGVHLGHIEYVASDNDRQVIPWVQRYNPDGSTTEYMTPDLQGKPAGELRTMDCIDCHNRAAHGFDTAEDALSRAMTEGAISTDLPFIHKKGIELLKATYATEAEAERKIPAGVIAFYKGEHPAVMAAHPELVNQAAESLVSIFKHNVFPEYKVTWGTHPNNIGHNSPGTSPYPGCFRCHDGSHNARNGTSITQDCSACHNLLAQDEQKPKVLTDLGIE